MRIALVETRGEKVAVNKDQAGSFGTATDVGNGLFGSLLNKIKRRGIRTPAIFMAYMSSILAKDGHDVTFYDRFPDDSNDLVIIMSSIVDYKNEIALAKRIKQSSKAKVGFIGAFSTVRPDIFLDAGDFVIAGEPEEATIRLSRGQVEPKGVVTSTLIKDLDTLPFPRWDDHPIDEYSYFPILKKRPFLTVLSSRGCPYDCHYCPYMVVETPLWRKRSPNNVVDEIELIVNNFGVKSFLFRDPMFTLDIERTRQICTEMIRRNLDVEWVCETRTDRLDEPLIDIMHEAGLRGINIGVEAFDLALLKKMNRKPPTHELQERIINYCEEHGVKIAAFHVLGIPGQDKEGIRQTIEYAKHLNTSFAQFTIATPYPGTKFYDQVKNDIMMNEDWQKYTAYTSLLRSDQYTSEELLRFKESAFKEYYLRWAWMSRRMMGVIAS
ncbi:MAG: B12-binding domain-containing radical SAM protein [Nitrososphaera sp.]